MCIWINPHVGAGGDQLRIYHLYCSREFILFGCFCFVFFTFLTAPPSVTLHSLQEKEVRKWKEELLEQRRRMMEERLLHAEFKRELQLQAIVKKAQEEEAKVEETKQ